MFESLRKKLSGIFSSQPEDAIRKDQLETEIRNALLEADVSLDTTDRIIAELDDFISNAKKKISRADLIKALRSSVLKILTENHKPIDILSVTKRPYVILFLGINGTGKTTTVAKVAHLIKNRGRRVVVAAADTFRAGAIEQISDLCQRIGVEVIKHTAGSDPASVAYDAIEHAVARNIDFVLIDSAGRMQTNKNLLEEMKKIKRVAKPDLTVLVLDAMIGQDAVNQAGSFLKETDFDAVIVTKLDTDAKGGSVITISCDLEKPVMYVGTGQNMGDLVPFTPEWYVSRIFPD
ncbi:MAG TPA: signal recognition particle-docking protein FtsY [Thermoplasmataceae archaeon]|nr:signal recognition particle-docking protein FtsY [Thermoplasmatales archaeon AK]HLH86193.1 signal recognition particle-docking protein FtsY [Thermoplasmataceae archaeon]